MLDILLDIVKKNKNCGNVESHKMTKIKNIINIFLSKYILNTFYFVRNYRGSMQTIMPICGQGKLFYIYIQRLSNKESKIDLSFSNIFRLPCLYMVQSFNIIRSSIYSTDIVC